MPEATETPDVTVVIVSYRCADHLAQCLQSIDRERGDLMVEVIVVDNASGDGTLQVAVDHPQVRVIVASANSGFARAANQGLARARGEFVLALNPDTTLRPGSLRALVRHLRDNPGIGVLSPRVVDERGDTDARCHRTFPTAWSSMCFATGLDQHLPARVGGGYLMRHLDDAKPADVDAVSGACMLMRAGALHRVGGFDQQFFMYAEDIDLCMRFRAAGWRVVYWPGADVMHAGGGSGEHGRRTARADAAAYRTMAPLIGKHRRGARGAVVAMTAAIAGEAMLAVSRLRRRAYS